MASPTVRVWDVFVRLFHWTLVIGVTVAAVTGFLIGGRAIDIHIWAGTTAVALVALRVLWGFAGPGFARFADFVRGPRAVIAHLKSGHRSLGHNPLGGWMVLALILLVVALGASGTALLGGVFHAGPAKALLTVSQGFSVRQVHELLAILLLVLVAAHLVGVLFESLRSRENLARAMVTGRKQARAGDPPLPGARAHPFIATALGAGGLLAMGALIATMSQASAPNAPVDVTGSDYAAQCADCHMAYHPSLLPAASWQQIMAHLDDHFGEDASLPEAEVASLAAYLTAYSADVTDSKPAVLMRRSTALEITDSPAWKRIHDELPEALFEAAPVYGEGNCAACHQDAESGWFYPGNIDIPKRATTVTQSETDDD